MSLIGNIIWFLTGGGFMGISWYIAGIFWSITIIGIPAGKQCFKIGTLCLFPFGKYVVNPGGGTGNFLLNLLWICITGLPLAIVEMTIGVSLCCTIVGIPFGKQHFKIARLSLTPFGSVVV